MKIGVDATSWGNNRGYGRHARALLRALVNLDREGDYTFFVDSDQNLELIPPGVKVRRVDASAPTAQAASSDGHRSLGDMWRMSRALSTPGFDLLLFPTVYSYVPVIGPAKKVLIIHDIIPEKFPDLTLPKPSARLFWQMKSALGRWQADAILTVSNYSRQGILEHFRLPAERVHVVGEASDPVFRLYPEASISIETTPHLAKFRIPPESRLVTYVGGFGPHKNLETLVAAFANLVARIEFSDVRLILVGEYQKEVFYSAFEAIREQIEALGIQDYVIFTGYLPDEELVVLHNCSTVLVLPSLMEGFGLPAIEAAACGCPVIATTASPLPELLGEGGLYFDPLKPQDLIPALTSVLRSSDLRQRMRTAGLNAANSLTWEKAAGQMKEILHNVARA